MRIPECFLLLSLFSCCSGVICYFCTTPADIESEHCKFYAECSPGYPGCLKLHTTEEGKPFIVKTCSFREQCNDTILELRNVPKLTIVSCHFCDNDLCNLDWALRPAKLTLFVSLFVRILVI